MKLVKARALALTCRPAGKSAHRFKAGSDQSCSTEMTAADFSSGVNNHSEPPIERPRPASTPSRTPSAALTRNRPRTVTVVSVVPWRNVQVGPQPHDSKLIFHGSR